MEIQISLQVEQMLFDKVRTFQLNNNLIWRCTEPRQKFWFGLFEVNMYKGKKERNWEVPLFVACPVCVPVFSLDDPSTTSLDKLETWPESFYTQQRPPPSYLRQAPTIFLFLSLYFLDGSHYVDSPLMIQNNRLRDSQTKSASFASLSLPFAKLVLHRNARFPILAFLL